ncbi:unnamed protein product [Prorocentrum cordatum]|uniref:CobW/HypB/UreG nucleotide-binding domain-containing protein n=1 Tax=Prorocentrum cordatum TaxID=2364126 RepID=A0ABN9XNP3_9DINO|nr:unnamed protein product [Polarella glacialis]
MYAWWPSLARAIFSRPRCGFSRVSLLPGPCPFAAMAHGHSHGVPASGSKLPVVILTGYLGAGKTTLLNYVLHEQQEKKLAVIENEVGEVSIDDALVEHKHEDLAEELVVLDNGCICCTIRGDLVKLCKTWPGRWRAATSSTAS